MLLVFIWEASSSAKLLKFLHRVHSQHKMFNVIISQLHFLQHILVVTVGFSLFNQNYNLSFTCCLRQHYMVKWPKSVFVFSLQVKVSVQPLSELLHWNSSVSFQHLTPLCMFTLPAVIIQCQPITAQ